MLKWRAILDRFAGLEHLATLPGEVDRVSGQLRIIQRTNQVAIRAHVDDNLNVVRFLNEDLFAELEGFDVVLLVVEFIVELVLFRTFFVKPDPLRQVLDDLGLTFSGCRNRTSQILFGRLEGFRLISGAVFSECFIQRVTLFRRALLSCAGSGRWSSRRSSLGCYR